MKEICFMKKLFILILVLISALALVSCGSTKEIQTIDDEAVATADSNQQVVTENRLRLLKNLNKSLKYPKNQLK